MESLTGDTVDISEWTDFSFYDRVWYWHSPASDKPARPGRLLGVAHHVGGWILASTGKKLSVLAHSSVQNVTKLEMQTDDVREQFVRLDVEIEKALDSGDHLI